MPALTPLVPVVSTTEFVPRTGGVVAAGGTVFETKLAIGDTQPTFRLRGAGDMHWGPGGSTAPDVLLYRSSVDLLQIEDSFKSLQSSISSGGLQVAVTGDTLARWVVRNGGEMSWGDGASSQDVKLFRQAVDELRTEDRLTSIRASSTDPTFSALQTGDISSRWFVQANGVHNWGPGNAATDISLTRIGVGQLQFSGEVRVSRAAVSNNTFTSIVSGDSNLRFLIQADGGHFWGSGSASQDVFLTRNTANQLQLGTGDSFTLGATTDAGGNYIQFFEQTTDPAAAPANAARLFAKDNGAGKTQLVVRFSTGSTVIIATEP